MTQTTPVLFILLTVAEAMLLLHAALRDIATRTIPDLGCLALAALGLLQRSYRHQLLAGLVVAGLVFLGGMLLWRRGWLGGGDVKLMAACACLVPPAESPALLGAIAISGGVLACLYLVAMRLGRTFPAPAAGRIVRAGALRRIARLEAWRIRRRAALPYGVAISTGALLQMLGA